MRSAPATSRRSPVGGREAASIVIESPEDSPDSLLFEHRFGALRRPGITTKSAQSVGDAEDAED